MSGVQHIVKVFEEKFFLEDFTSIIGLEHYSVVHLSLRHFVSGNRSPTPNGL